MLRHVRAKLALTAWCVILLATVTVAAGPLQTALPLSLDAGPVTVVFAVGARVLIAAAWWLLATTVVSVAARVFGAVRVARISESLSLPFVRRLAHAAVGVSLATVTAAPAVATPTLILAPSEPSDVVTLERGSSMWAQLLPPPAAHPKRTPPASERQPPVQTWTVQPGDHLWRVAEVVMRRVGVRDPSPADVAPYWQMLIDANRDRLADPANPDLVFPGQVLVLPRTDAR